MTAKVTDASESDAQLPEGWRWARLGDFVLSYRNGFGRRPNGREDGPIVLRLADVSTGVIDLSEARRVAMTKAELDSYRVEPGDLLFVRVNGSADLVGRCIVVGPQPEDIAYNDHLIRVRLCDGLEPAFLAAACSLPSVRTYIAERASTSAGQLTVNQDALASVPIPVPSMEEQRRIVAVLGQQMAAIERARAAAAAQFDAIGKLPAALLRRAFSGEA